MGGAGGGVKYWRGHDVIGFCDQVSTSPQPEENIRRMCKSVFKKVTPMTNSAHYKSNTKLLYDIKFMFGTSKVNSHYYEQCLNYMI